MPFSTNSFLEPELEEPYSAWKKAPGPQTNAMMLKALQPTLAGAVRTHVGETNPLLQGHAKLLAIEGLHSYDPTKGRLQTHLYNHLQGLKRLNRQQTQILKVPERLSLDRYHLGNAEAELQAVLGREPTDAELADHTGFSQKRMARTRSWSPAISEGMVAATPDDAGQPGVRSDPSGLWAQIIYDELDDHHKKVMEYSFGLHGRAPLANHQIAAKLHRTPGAISQAKARIQAKLDEQYDLEGVL